MHVFTDLRPYICTFTDCKDELAQFTNRAAWADHEFTEHRYDGIWYCPECSEKLASASDWEQHLQKMHQRVFTGPQLHVARDTAYQARPRPVETEECPLCRVLGKPRRAFVKHIARHMKEIALMALPCSTGEDLDEGSVSTDEICPASGFAKLLAASLVDLPGGTEIGSEESSISTLGESLGSENAELPPAKTKIKACQERSRDQTNKQSKDKITSQQEPPSQDMEAAGLNQDSLTTAGIETAINPTPAHDRQIVGGLIKSGRQTPGTGGASCPLPPHLPKPRYWSCGHCLEGRQMSIRLDLFCASCGRRKDYYAREY